MRPRETDASQVWIRIKAGDAHEEMGNDEQAIRLYRKALTIASERYEVGDARIQVTGRSHGKQRRNPAPNTSPRPSQTPSPSFQRKTGACFRRQKTYTAITGVEANGVATGKNGVGRTAPGCDRNE